jgi:hypothetical protein
MSIFQPNRTAAEKQKIVAHKKAGGLQSVAQFRNKLTGKIFFVRAKAARMARVERRVTEWGYAVDPFLSDSRFRLKHVMLSYARAEDWHPNDRRDFMLRLRARLKDENIIAYAVVAELQTRGAVHYHLMIIIKRGVHFPFMDKAGLWTLGSTGVRSRSNPWYLIQYAKKEKQKGGDFPKGCRLCDVWVNRKFVGLAARWRLRLSAVPLWVARECLFECIDWPRHILLSAAGREKLDRLRARSWVLYERAAAALSDKIGWFVGIRKIESPFEFMGFVPEAAI